MEGLKLRSASKSIKKHTAMILIPPKIWNGIDLQSSSAESPELVRNLEVSIIIVVSFNREVV